MGKFAKRSCQQMLASKYYEHDNNKLNEANNFHQQNCWKLFTEKNGEKRCDDHTISYYSSDSFPSSSESESEPDLIEDASSSSSSLLSNGPLFKLSDLMAQLPVKRGLSKYYEGKSQSYATLANVESLEDLAKREQPYTNKRIKYCNSFCGGGDLHQSQRLETDILNNNHSSNPKPLFFFQDTAEKC